MMTVEQEPELTYFTCTLAQAAQVNAQNPNHYKTINDFIDTQARQFPDRAAVAFPVPGAGKHEEWKSVIISYRDLQTGSLNAARQFVHTVRDADRNQEQQCVALICPSSADFLFAWLGLIRLGCAVLLIAPQCQPEAIAHLCATCKVKHVFHDRSFENLVRDAVATSSNDLSAHLLPWTQSGIDPQQLMKQSSTEQVQRLFTATENCVAYIHHTSGTSTGLPKPIPQTHRGSCTVLPCLDGSSAATFTTTPLYHGGVADCFRAWTSGALIWLFPGAQLPITAQNITLSFDVTRRESTAPVKYFCSVPYILQMLAEDARGMKMLQQMDIVGVGGAALPDSSGQTLVNNGVNLISRFGSAECGFLLSSHRDYSKDKHWQYLRVPQDNEYLCFEPQDDGSGLSELIVKKGWPHMAKMNRDNGDFATCDLFEPLDGVEGAWRYHSRSDSQITLITGKKFDPAPIEDALVAAVDSVRDVLVFGNGRQAAGALVFIKDQIHDANDLVIEAIWKGASALNDRGQDHTRISRDMIVMMRSGTLKKSSKGTVLRSIAEKEFSMEIEAAYVGDTLHANGTSDVVPQGETEIREATRTAVAQVMSRTIEDNQSFFASGVTSAECTRVRALLQKTFQRNLAWNILYDQGSINGLVKFLLGSSDVPVEKAGISTVAAQEMQDMVNRYSSFDIKQSTQGSMSDSGSSTVLLTGATGALGSHILLQLLSSAGVSKVYCLVRASDDDAARERVMKSLESRRLIVNAPNNTTRKLVCLASNLISENLGLATETVDTVRRETTVIIHAAWDVNFALGLKDFVPAFAGLQNLLRLSVSTPSPANFVFCSSTASVLGSDHPSLIQEVLSNDPHDSDALGYSKSKWVAESMCAGFAKAFQSKWAAVQSARCTVKIVRVGQLTGDTQHGIWNMSEAYPLMLSTAKVLKCLPLIQDALTWLPLDVAARAIIEIALPFATLGDSRTTGVDVDPRCTVGAANGGDGVAVYHVLNPRADSTVADMINWIRSNTRADFETVQPTVWLKKLAGLDTHPAKSLLGLWETAYGSVGTDEKHGNGSEATRFECERARFESAAMREDVVVGPGLWAKIWEWIEGKLAE